MEKHKNVGHLSEISPQVLAAPEGSSFGGLRQAEGTAVGAKKLGYSLFTVPPGKAAFPFHLHNCNEEMIFILAGQATLRLGEVTVPVSVETFIACPPGPDYPHQLINTGTGELRYLVVSTMETSEVAEYPDSNKVGVYVRSGGQLRYRAFYVKGTDVKYFEGEKGPETY